MTQIKPLIRQLKMRHREVDLVMNHQQKLNYLNIEIMKEVEAKGKLIKLLNISGNSNEKVQSKGFINNIGQNKKLDGPNHLINIKPESKNVQANKDIGNKRALLWVIIKNNQ